MSTMDWSQIVGCSTDSQYENRIRALKNKGMDTSAIHRTGHQQFTKGAFFCDFWRTAKWQNRNDDCIEYQAFR